MAAVTLPPLPVQVISIDGTVRTRLFADPREKFCNEYNDLMVLADSRSRATPLPSPLDAQEPETIARK